MDVKSYHLKRGFLKVLEQDSGKYLASKHNYRGYAAVKTVMTVDVVIRNCALTSGHNLFSMTPFVILKLMTVVSVEKLVKKFGRGRGYLNLINSATAAAAAF